MKTRYLLLTLALQSAVWALPVGNPSEASLLCDGIFFEGHCGDPCDPCLTVCDAFSMRFGYWGDYQFNRYLEKDSASEAKRDTDVTRVITNAAYFAGNFWDRFDIFGTLGATSVNLWSDQILYPGHSVFQDTTGPTTAPVVTTTTFGTTASGQVLSHLQTNTGFSWSIGGRITLWECECTAIGLEGQYLQSRPHLKFLDLYQNQNVTVNNVITTRDFRQAFGNGYRVRYEDWQVGLGISHRINKLVPYAAIRWSGAKLKCGNAQLANVPTPSLATTGVDRVTTTFNANLPNFKQIKSTGYAVGVSLTDCQKMALTLEGGFASSLEMSLVGQVRF
ncbi:MAG: Major outer membrane porin [Chlamydiales bacterium]|nr:Major outer membrane porin [Chlamydiales bacterium]MCH9635947.1 Major outer membrane porin [Chlamydiales bacterium]MCH9703232.1 hypothetical protein [Chlamydiota bacterium]